ncbi:MAG: hypothetical protein EZS28_032626, partial [Streblomastix strix]
MSTVCFSGGGIQFVHFLPKGTTIDSKVFISEVIKPRQQKYIKEYHAKRGQYYLHFDNAPIHKSQYTQTYINAGIFSVLKHPLYSPDISPCDYYLFAFDVVENEVVLNTEDEGYYGKFMHDGTRTQRDITINNVNILILDIDKVNLLRDSYKLYVYTKTETETKLGEKANKSDTFTKTETDTLLVAKVDKTDILDAYIKIETDTKLDEKADKTELIDQYTKTETDTMLDFKANVSDTIDSYSKTEDDAILLLKAEKSNTYSKTETDTNLDLKDDKAELIGACTKTESDEKLDLKLNIADQTDTYTKTKTDILLDAKADNTDLANYVDLTFALTIQGQNQFNNISVATVSKQNINDASILLACGGEMLVTSLVTQPQLYEIRDIATCKSKAYVFDTQSDWIDWMTIQDNVANLSIEDNLFIVDKEVTDNWQDGTNLRILEIELPDISNIIITLGAATGSDNAIIDLQIDGITQRPAKNTTFVTTDNDQSITKMKTLTNTIISNDTQYSGYDNNSKILARCGVKAISYINASSTTANKTLNNNCRFDNSTDGMSTLICSQFIKLGADNAVVLLGTSGTKPISEFG